uniref:Gag-asp_proteas domain-containing protein n=1 Tax=Panagrolaimus davidi TaxID=227884 RepID=A0A914QTJ8_9BILA
MSFDASSMNFFKAAYKCLLKPALRIEVDEERYEQLLREVKPRIGVASKGVEFVALVDLGSELSMMKLTTFQRLRRSLKRKTARFSYKGGPVQESLGSCLIPLRIGNMKVAHVFHITEDDALPEPCILGTDLLHRFRCFGFLCNGRKMFLNGTKVPTLK